MINQVKIYNLVYNEATGLYDCDGDVKIGKDLVSPDGKLIIKFGVVKGDFDCSANKLTSPEGVPQVVGESFYCYNNDNFVFDETHFYGCLPDVIGGKLKADDGCDYELAKDYYNPR